MSNQDYTVIYWRGAGYYTARQEGQYDDVKIVYRWEDDDPDYQTGQAGRYVPNAATAKKEFDHFHDCEKAHV